MKKTNVCFVMQNLSGGGAERILINILKFLDRDKFNIKLFLIDKFGKYLNEVPEDIEVFGYRDEQEIEVRKTKKISRIKSELEIFKIAKVASSFCKDCDLVVGYLEFESSYLAALIGRKLNISSVGWIHTSLDNHFPKGFRGFKHRIWSKWSFRKLDAVFSVSREAMEIAIRQFPVLKSKMNVIYNPNNLSEIRKLSKEPITEKNVFLEDAYNLIGVGRLLEVKGFDLLIKAHHHLLTADIPTNLIILGDGPEKENLRKLAKDLSVENSVHLLGFVSNPYKYLEKADMFVLSSRYEGLPTVLIEAMALGKCTVATNCPTGPKEIVENEKSGLLVYPGSSEAIAEGIAKIISNPALQKMLQLESKKRAEFFSVEHIIPKIEREFLSLGKEK
ncbi:glycosyltransferase [Massilibacterium senegalense]|uniref:glycosyltransferase n=1 Tax=Massilibacterium senegalense TaxID=1632858 RepID=UPI0007814083|nr:glycosyltransferase [Massilibacterium senegalense]